MVLSFGNALTARGQQPPKAIADMWLERALGKGLICYLKQILASLLQHGGIKKNKKKIAARVFERRPREHLEVNQVYFHIITGVIIWKYTQYENKPVHLSQNTSECVNKSKARVRPAGI